MIIDSHVHLLPDRLAQAIRRFFEQHLTSDLVYPLDPEVVLTSHAALGVEAVWNLPYAHKAGVAETLNRDVAALSRQLSQHGPQVIPGCTVHPDDPDPENCLLQAVEEYGARVLKLHCSVSGYPPDDPRLEAVWEAVSRMALPVVVHAGNSPAGTTTAAELAPLGRIVSRYPQARVVLAHLGAPAWRAAVELMREHTNLYADLTPVVSEPVQPDSEALEGLAGRLLFGSDAPNTGVTAARLMEVAERLFPRSADLGRVMGETAAELVDAVRVGA